MMGIRIRPTSGYITPHSRRDDTKEFINPMIESMRMKGLTDEEIRVIFNRATQKMGGDKCTYCTVLSRACIMKDKEIRRLTNKKNKLKQQKNVVYQKYMKCRWEMKQVKGGSDGGEEVRV